MNQVTLKYLHTAWHSIWALASSLCISCIWTSHGSRGHRKESKKYCQLDRMTWRETLSLKQCTYLARRSIVLEKFAQLISSIVSLDIHLSIHNTRRQILLMRLALKDCIIRTVSILLVNKGSNERKRKKKMKTYSSLRPSQRIRSDIQSNPSSDHLATLEPALAYLKQDSSLFDEWKTSQNEVCYLARKAEKRGTEKARQRTRIKKYQSIGSNEIDTAASCFRAE